MRNLDDIITEYRTTTSYLFGKLLREEITMEQAVEETRKQDVIFKRRLVELINGAVSDKEGGEDNGDIKD